MNCDEFRNRIDAYIDDELPEDVRAQFLKHAGTCRQCNEELKQADALKALLGGMDDSVSVPLEAQAGWRRAVREEAGRRKSHRWQRGLCAVAAAAVVVFGCSFALKSDIFKSDTALPAPAVEGVQDSGALIARDGEMPGTTQAAARSVDSAAFSQGGDHSAWRKIETSEYEQACETVEALADEYSGSFSSEAASDQAGSRETSYTVSLPSEYMGDFLNAVSRIGMELDSETIEAVGEEAIVVLQICEAK